MNYISIFWCQHYFPVCIHFNYIPCCSSYHFLKWSSINDIRINKLHWNLIPVYREALAMDFYRCYIQVQFFKIFWLTVQLFRLKYRAASKNYRWHEFIFLVLWPTHQISRAYIYLMEVSFDPFLSASP